MNLVIVSGGFDPLHKGHIEYFKLAKEFAEKKNAKVLCIANLDSFLLQKKGYVAIPMDSRLAVLKAIKYIDMVLPAIDTDLTVCNSLRHLKEVYPNLENAWFVKGGDRFADEIPEATVCRECGITMLDRFGEKIASSSEIITKNDKLNYN